MRGWHTTFNKPIIITEYGADTVAGLHQVRVYGWMDGWMDGSHAILRPFQPYFSHIRTMEGWQ